MVRDFCQEIQSRATVIDEGDEPIAAMIGAVGVSETTEATSDNSIHQFSPRQAAERPRAHISELLLQGSLYRSYEADRKLSLA